MDRAIIKSSITKPPPISTVPIRAPRIHVLIGGDGTGVTLVDGEDQGVAAGFAAVRQRTRDERTTDPPR